MISETMWKTIEFYLVLFIFIVSYTILRMFMFQTNCEAVFRVAYTLTLGELDDF